MNEQVKKSILEMARGGFLERVDYEMPGIIRNILDPNTKATAKRTLTIKMVFTPDEERSGFTTDFTVKSGLASTNAIRTSMYICGEDSTGEVQVVEMVPQLPGQTNLDGGEQDAPNMLKLVNF